MKQAIAKINLNLQWFFIVVILVFSTLDFGGIYPRAIYLTRLLIVSIFFLQLVFSFFEDRYLNDFPRALFFPLLLFISFLILIYVQYFFGLRILQHSIIGTVNTYVTYDALIQLVIYFLFFVVCLNITRKRELVERLGSLIVVLTFTIAVLGLAQRLITDERILWRALSSVRGSFFGPFVNENHFGGFLALTFPLALGLMHYRFNKIQREFATGPKKTFWVRWSALLNEGVVFLFFLIILTLVACFFSLARVSLFVLLFCCAAYFIAYGITKRNLKFYLTLLIILMCSFFLAQWLRYSSLAVYFRVESFKTAWNIRFDVVRQSLALLREYPLFGTGLGTYGFVSSKVVTCLINELWWNHAHNDYVELLIETGAVGFSLFISAILILIVLSFRQLKKNLSHWNKSIAIQSLISIMCIAIMEYSDFHLRIPSIALFFTLQLAILFQSSFNKEGQDSSQFTKIKVGIFKGIVIFVGLILCIPIVIFSTNEYRVSKLIQTTGDNRLTNLQKAVQLQPSNAKLWHLLGWEYETDANKLNSKDENMWRLKQKAISAFRKTVALSPTYDTYWYDLGTLEYGSGYEKEGLISLEKAVDWSPATLKHSVYLLAAYLRESERISSIDKKMDFLNKAKSLYKKIQHLEVKPNDGSYRIWMGENYYNKLQQLIHSWKN